VEKVRHREGAIGIMCDMDKLRYGEGTIWGGFHMASV
jgi:hypothetical protein